MSPINDRQLARKLRAGKTPEPPPGLLEKLRREIPEQIEAPPPPQTGLLPFRRPVPRRVWLAAASVAMLLGGGTLSYVALTHRGLGDIEPREDMFQVGQPPADASGGSAEAMQPRDRRAWGDAGPGASAAMPSPVPASPGRFGEAREEAVEMRVDERRPAPPAVRPMGPARQLAARPQSSRNEGIEGDLAKRDAGSTGSLTVRARDQQGTPLSGVTVEARGMTGTRVQVTNEQGEAKLGDLPAGDYQVKAKLEGFTELNLDGIDVSPEGRTNVEARLETAAVEEIVTLAESPLTEVGAEAEASPVDRIGGVASSTPAAGARAKAPSGEDKEAARRDQARRAAAEPAPAPMPAPPSPAAAAPAPPPRAAAASEPVFGAKQSYRVSTFVDSKDDALSSFALDVDTGSFDEVRRSLEHRELPSASAVRVEELVSSFDYGDQAPARGDFALTAEAATNPWAAGDRYVLVRFAVTAREGRAGEAETVATSARAEVEVDPRYVASWRRVGDEAAVVPSHASRDATDGVAVAAGRSVSALYELELQPEVPPSATLATLRLYWTPAAGGPGGKQEHNLRESEVVARWEKASRAFRLAMLAGRFGELLRASQPAAAAAFEDLAAKAATVAADWPRQLRVDELEEMIVRARDLRRRQ